MKKTSKVILAATGAVVSMVGVGVLSYKFTQKEISSIRIEARPGE